jgi:5'-3' exonuclease
MIGEVNRFNLVILLDLNWAGMRSVFRFVDFAVNTSQGRILTGSLFGVLQLIESLSTNYPFAQIIVCDDGSPAERKKLFEGYKASRVPTADNPIKPEVSAWRNLKPELFRMLGGIPNLTVLRHPEKEADDLMAKLAYLNLQAGKDVVIFTSDKDLMQLMAAGANIAKEVSDGELVLLTEDYVLNHDKLGVEPKYIPYLRPWSGDPSDDIPAAASRVSKEIKARVAQGWYDSGNKELTEETLTHILDNIKDVNVTPKTRQKFIDGIQQANLNFKLMDLTRYETESIEGVQVVPLSFNRETVLYYGLKKYLGWREGYSMSAINPDSILSSL